MPDDQLIEKQEYEGTPPGHAALPFNMDAVEKQAAPPAPDRENGIEPFAIVGMGASAGGLEALIQFFHHAPMDGGLAFVVIQHLSPNLKTLMPELLARHAGMPVQTAQNSQEVRPGHIYLIPPGKNMTIQQGRLMLATQIRTRKPNFPIDVFLHSLAEDQAHRAVAIILSGTGSDGVRGIRAIKEAGGMVMVQDEETAKFDGMPHSAILTGMADYVLAPRNMPAQLMSYAKTPRIETPRMELQIQLDKEYFMKIVGLLTAQGNTDYSQYKHTTILRRIQRRMSLNQIDSMSKYFAFLKQSPRETSALDQEILIGVTRFFRDPEAMAFLEQKVVHELCRRTEPGGAIRIWTPGCSTGEEAYSLAILFLEQASVSEKPIHVKIFATDIDRKAIEFGSVGAYPESIETDLTRERLERFFIKRGGTYQVGHRLRETVIFTRHDLLRHPPFSKISLISCRNLLIYFKHDTQQHVLSSFHYALEPADYLFLGMSETIGGHAAEFEAIHTKYSIYQRRAASMEHPARNLLPAAPPSEKLDAEWLPCMSHLECSAFDRNTRNPQPADGVQGSVSEEAARQRIEKLEIELKCVKAHLHASIKELETSNEELQAVREELQGTNEELQSLNEELHTINAEYLARSHELALLNDDIENLLRSMNAASLFIDQELRIRKYSPAASMLFHLIPQDIGRTLTHLSLTFGECRLLEEVHKVMQTLSPVEREIRTAAGRWLRMRILPYRTDMDRTNGVVVTLVPMDELRKAQETLQRERDATARQMDAIPLGIVMTNVQGVITFINTEAEKILGVRKESVLKRPCHDAGWRWRLPGGQRMPDEESVFRRVMHTGKPVQNARCFIERPDGIHMMLLMNAAPILNGLQYITGAIATIQNEAALSESIGNGQVSSLTHRFVIAVNRDFQVQYWSQNAENLFGHMNKDALGLPLKKALGGGNEEFCWDAVRNALKAESSWESVIMLHTVSSAPIQMSVQAERVDMPGSGIAYLFSFIPISN